MIALCTFKHPVVVHELTKGTTLMLSPLTLIVCLHSKMLDFNLLYRHKVNKKVLHDTVYLHLPFQTVYRCLLFNSGQTSLLAFILSCIKTDCSFKEGHSIQVFHTFSFKTTINNVCDHPNRHHFQFNSHFSQ